MLRVLVHVLQDRPHDVRVTGRIFLDDFPRAIRRDIVMHDDLERKTRALHQKAIQRHANVVAMIEGEAHHRDARGAEIALPLGHDGGFLGGRRRYRQGA